MSLFDWMNNQIKKMKWYDISLIKISSAAFALFIAKIWAPILSLAWYWYIIIGLAVALPVLKKVFAKESAPETEETTPED